jgi:hypothetical protein
MVNDDFPLVPEPLLKALSTAFPHRLPRPCDTQAQIMFDAGARSVIEFLKQKQEQQTQTALTKGQPNVYQQSTHAKAANGRPSASPARPR